MLPVINFVVIIDSVLRITSHINININIIYIYYTGISHNCIYYYYTYNSHIKKHIFLMLIKKNFFYSIVLVHASSVRSRDWTRTCSWTLNWTRTEPIDKVRVRFEFKYHGFGFGSSSGIIGSSSVRVRVQGSMNSNRTEPNLGTLVKTFLCL